jgi:hypothetical protein
VDSLKALDPKRPIREADMTWPSAAALARMRVEFLNRSLPP